MINLSKIDIDRTSITLLDKKSFFIPFDHHDYFYCFSSDEGVQQLVSHYYYLYSKKTHHIKYLHKKNMLDKTNVPLSKKKSITLLSLIFNCLIIIKRKIIKLLIKLGVIKKTKVALLGVQYSRDIIKKLYRKSWGEIKKINLPIINFSHRETDYKKRKELINLDSDDEFENYFIESLYFCIPKLLIENFKSLFDVYENDIKNNHESVHTVVSENWISDIKIALYCGILQNNGRTFICQEHATGNDMQEHTTIWMDYLASDKFLTTGWSSQEPKIVKGGFCSRNIINYIPNNENLKILYVGNTLMPYLSEFSNQRYNNDFFKRLLVVKNFMNDIPEKVRDHLIYRPRRLKYFWDTEHTCGFDKNEIKIDTIDFHQSILKSRLVIIDNLSTPLAELLMMNVPFMLLINKNIRLDGKYNSIFDLLSKANVVHYSSDSLISNLSNIINDVMDWWSQDNTGYAVSLLKNAYLAPAENTIDYLLSTIKD